MKSHLRVLLQPNALNSEQSALTIGLNKEIENKSSQEEFQIVIFIAIAENILRSPNLRKTTIIENQQRQLLQIAHILMILKLASSRLTAKPSECNGEPGTTLLSPVHYWH